MLFVCLLVWWKKGYYTWNNVVVVWINFFHFLIIILLFIWKYVILSSSSSSSLEISRLYSLFLFGYKGWIFVVVVVMSTRACIMRVNDVNNNNNNKVIMTLKLYFWTKLNYWMTGFGFWILLREVIKNFTARESKIFFNSSYNFFFRFWISKQNFDEFTDNVSRNFPEIKIINFPENKTKN